jgi:hypothetical protein
LAGARVVLIDLKKMGVVGQAHLDNFWGHEQFSPDLCGHEGEQKFVTAQNTILRTQIYKFVSTNFVCVDSLFGPPRALLRPGW